MGTLKRQGICCGQNRVARLMRQAGLKARLVKVTRRAPGVHRFFEATDEARLEQGAPRSVNQQWWAMIPFSRRTAGLASWPPGWMSTPDASWVGLWEEIARCT